MHVANPWSKFFWNDWENDPALRLCSLEAQGLWMRLLCLAAKSNPTGFVAVAGRPCSSTDIARLSGVSEQEVGSLLGELSRNGVFSRDAQGRIYCRRMVRDNRKRQKLRQNGAKGGQASFLNGKGIFAAYEQNTEQPSEQGSEPQKPESRVHKPESKPPVGPPAAKPKAEAIPITPDWSLPESWRETARTRGWSDAAVDQQAVKFKQYFGFGKGSGLRRGDKGWRQAWLNWLDRELRLRPDAATVGGKADAPVVLPDYPPLPDNLLEKLKRHYAFNASAIRRWLEPCQFDIDGGVIFAPTGFHASYLENHYGDALTRTLGRSFKFLVKPREAAHGATN
ncbi:MAG: hypothetical protein KGI97_01325 [Alphaproteobacteria bacterium]|nr:hypothetical protein [Alphaproteobacteria bacterium]